MKTVRFVFAFDEDTLRQHHAEATAAFEAEGDTDVPTFEDYLLDIADDAARTWFGDRAFPHKVDYTVELVLGQRADVKA